MLALAPQSEIVLRDYQAEAIDALRARIRAGQRRLILCAPTGAGKTICASHLLREADRKGSYALFAVDRLALVDQTSAVLDGYGIRHGVVQGIHPRWAPRENVQVASIQTLARRELPRRPSLIVYDECHAQYRSTLAFIAAHPEAVAIGLTATPFTKGMGEHWDGVVNVRTTRALIADGHLVEPTLYVARSPDDAEMTVGHDGEFTDASATAAGVRIIGDVVSEWERKVHQHFGGPAKTLVFSPTVEHGRELCAAFGAAGYNFQQVSYRDRDDERAARIAEFRRPDSVIHGLVSCGVLTKGFDVPDACVGISCRPYRKSLSNHIQEIGRVMRPHPGKRAIWLCHSGNLERFAADVWDIWEHGPGDLDKSTKRDAKARTRDATDRKDVACPECAALLRGPVCAACGWERPYRSGVHAVPGEMHAFDLRASVGARDGLRAECVGNPWAVWQAALAYTAARARNGDGRKWAYGIWKGVYPGAPRLPRGWFDAPVPALWDADAMALVEREVARFRKRRAA